MYVINGNYNLKMKYIFLSFISKVKVVYKNCSREKAQAVYIDWWCGLYREVVIIKQETL